MQDDAELALKIVVAQVVLDRSVAGHLAQCSRSLRDEVALYRTKRHADYVAHLQGPRAGEWPSEVAELPEEREFVSKYAISDLSPTELKSLPAEGEGVDVKYCRNAANLLLALKFLRAEDVDKGGKARDKQRRAASFNREQKSELWRIRCKAEAVAWRASSRTYVYSGKGGLKQIKEEYAKWVAYMALSDADKLLVRHVPAVSSYGGYDTDSSEEYDPVMIVAEADFNPPTLDELPRMLSVRRERASWFDGLGQGLFSLDAATRREFIFNGDGRKGIRKRVAREKELRSALAARNVTPRRDSALCNAFIHSAQGDPDKIAETMEEMAWLFSHTNYPTRVHIIVDGCAEGMRGLGFDRHYFRETLSKRRIRASEDVKNTLAKEYAMKNLSKEELDELPSAFVARMAHTPTPRMSASFREWLEAVRKLMDTERLN